MACCGERPRGIGITSSSNRAPSTQTEFATSELSAGGHRTPSSTAFSAVAVRVRYLETAPIVVRGAATGRRYQFSGIERVQRVDARDVEGLLRSTFFRRHYD